MATTQNTYTGDNSTVSYSFTFPYLEETDIKVSLDGVVTTAYTLSNATTVTFNTAPGTGVAIRIYRDTNNDELAATFFAGSAIRAQDLNDDFLQNAYVTQEVKNRYLDKNTGGTITGDVAITGDFDVTGDTDLTGAVDVTGNVGITGTLDMNANRILDVGTPTAGTDATNKTYVDTQDALRVAKAGDTMTGNLAMSNNRVTGLGTPSATTDAANKAYVDANILTGYQGPQASDPTTRTGGGALEEGDLYFNTTEDVLKAYTGTEWVVSASAGQIVRWRVTAAGGETELSGNDDDGNALSYVVGNEQVFLNGVLQQRGVDYTASTGTSITGLTALTAGDIVELHAVQGYTSGTVTDGSITSAKIANDTIVNADVNSSAGIVATKLSFTQSGTGATARTVDSKLKDVVSVKDFGATGDGTTDDTAAFNAAITYINSLGGGVVRVPMSSTPYIVNEVDILVPGVIIEGDGSNYRYNTTDQAGPTIRAASGASYAFKLGWQNTTNEGRHSGFRRLTIDGNSAADYGVIITTGATEMVNVSCINFSQAGVILAGFGNQNIFQRCSFLNNTVGFAATSHLLADNIFDSGVLETGEPNSFTTLFEADNCNFRSNTYGIVLSQCQGAVFKDSVIEANTKHGLMVYRAGQDNDGRVTLARFERCWFEGNWSGWSSGTTYNITDSEILVQENLSTSVEEAWTWTSADDSGYTIWISSQDTATTALRRPENITFEDCVINATDRYVKVHSGRNVLFKNYKGINYSGSFRDDYLVLGSAASYVSFDGDGYVKPTNGSTSTPYWGDMGYAIRNGVTTELAGPYIYSGALTVANYSVGQGSTALTEHGVEFINDSTASNVSDKTVYLDDSSNKLSYKDASSNINTVALIDNSGDLSIEAEGSLYAQNANNTRYVRIFNDASAGKIQTNTDPLIVTSADFIRLSSTTNEVQPGSDNTHSLGTASRRWSEVFAGTGTINTSDERAKQNIRELSDAESRVATTVKGLVKVFQYNDAIQIKGDNARLHFGVVAQEIIAAFQSEGLDPMRYGVVCYNQWDEEIDAETGELIPAGDRYGIRYEELLAFIIAAL